ncbi:hypothetical protein ATJ88_1082 [Isoptericola jiangsuensis]|uniref:Uncharacterized protein n=1 Tax=Isoptericola jiangsuensis TaxID=548579 RepID=A0A2A9EV81_9MICO|nr:hypothetical protein ATJ88_1082 [Isoptericola jiangsuensis]
MSTTFQLVAEIAGTTAPVLLWILTATRPKTTPL